MISEENNNPVRIFLSGCSGHMGHVIIDICSTLDDVKIVAGADSKPLNLGFPVYARSDECREEFDVIIDFSHPSALPAVLRLAESTKKPLVMCTTGFSDGEIQQIKALSDKCAVFLSGNMSLGINVLLELVKRAAEVLSSDFDIEIIEAHHRRKIDAPSGTALMIANEINDSQGDIFEYQYDRHSEKKPRADHVIGIHSVRGGNIVGEHSVLFAGPEENLTISHSANTRDVFARGAVKAAVFMKGKDPGLYSMRDLLGRQ